MDELTDEIIGAAIEVHRALGPEVAKAQTLSYLKATGLKRALLLHFGMSRLTDGIIRLSM